MSRTIAMKRQQEILCERTLPKSICDAKFGKTSEVSDPKSDRRPKPTPPGPPGPDPPGPPGPPGPPLKPSKGHVYQGMIGQSPTSLKWHYGQGVKNSVPMDVQADAFATAQGYNLEDSYKKKIREYAFKEFGANNADDLKIPLDDLEKKYPGLHEAYDVEHNFDDIADAEDKLITQPQDLFGVDPGDTIQWVPEEATNIHGVYHDREDLPLEDNVGNIHFLGEGSGRDPRGIDTPLRKLVAAGKQAEAEALFKSSGTHKALRRMVEEQVSDGVTEIHIHGHSTGGWAARSSLKELADAYPNIKFVGKGQGSHGADSSKYGKLPENAEYEYHTMINDKTSLKNRAFFKNEIENGASANFYEAKVNDPIDIFQDPRVSAYQSHQINMYYDPVGDETLAGNQPLDRAKGWVMNKDGELESKEPHWTEKFKKNIDPRNWDKEMVADQASNFTGGIAGDLITSHFIDKKLGIKNPVGKELAHTAISSTIGAGISGTTTGVARAGTLAYAQGGLENTAARFGEGFLETGAIGGAGMLAGGIAGDLADMGVHAGLRAAGVKEGTATSVANITGGAVTGGVGVLAMTEAGAALGAEAGPIGVGIGALGGAAIAGGMELYQHRQAVENMFSKAGKELTGYLGFKHRDHGDDESGGT